MIDHCFILLYNDVLENFMRLLLCYCQVVLKAMILLCASANRTPSFSSNESRNLYINGISRSDVYYNYDRNLRKSFSSCFFFKINDEYLTGNVAKYNTDRGHEAIKT